MDHEMGQQIGAWLGGVLCGILGAVGGGVLAVMSTRTLAGFLLLILGGWFYLGIAAIVGGMIGATIGVYAGTGMGNWLSRLLGDKVHTRLRLDKHENE